jgi:predicted alpha/beta-hydrolase family hydrolase
MFLHRPQHATGEGMALTHGAGGDCGSALLLAIAEGFAEAGVTVLRFDLAFKALRRPAGPATGAADRESIRVALKALRAEVAGLVYLAGQSYGGRQASMLAAQEPKCADALVLFSYPLHPPGKPLQLRTAHFAQIQTPTLFVHGPRDTFASTEELEAARAFIPARTAVHEVAKAGHDLLRGKFALAPIVDALQVLKS